MHLLRETCQTGFRLRQAEAVVDFPGSLTSDGDDLRTRFHQEDTSAPSLSPNQRPDPGFEVRFVGPSGETVGIVPTADAPRLAQEADLDLVETPMARPPVCSLMDYGKFKYENAQKARRSSPEPDERHHQGDAARPKIDAHDYETKKGHVVRFLRAGDKVKITIMFRGREQHRPEPGVPAAAAPGRGRHRASASSSRRPSRTAATWSWCSARTRRRPTPRST